MVRAKYPWRPPPSIVLTMDALADRTLWTGLIVLYVGMPLMGDKIFWGKPLIYLPGGLTEAILVVYCNSENQLVVRCPNVLAVQDQGEDRSADCMLL